MGDLQVITNNQQAHITVTFRNALQIPIPVTQLTLSVSDPKILALSAPAINSNAQTFSVDCTIAAAGVLGTASLVAAGSDSSGETITAAQEFTVVRPTVVRPTDVGVDFNIVAIISIGNPS
jgi:hypothetical protein